MEVVLISLAFICVFSSIPNAVKSDNDHEKQDFLVLTVATEENDGFKRFVRSVKKFDLDYKVIGLGKKWDGGDVAYYAGGGHKVNLIKDVLEDYKDKTNLVLMFVDSYDLIVTATEEQILKQFAKFNAKVVFSTESVCWPNAKLADQYPEVKANENRYLNSGGFIGFAPELYEIVTSSEIGNRDDDQLFYTQVFLNNQTRERFSIKLDTKGKIFQNLNGALDDVELKFKGSNSYLYNAVTGNQPLIIHDNGPIKLRFNQLTNYLADQWTPTHGCQFCMEDTISLKGVKEEDYPQVMAGIFIENITPFTSDFFQRFSEQAYPKKKIDLFIHYADQFHEQDVDTFIGNMGSHYRSLSLFTPMDNITQWDIRNKALEECLKKNCKYYLSLDAEAHLEYQYLIGDLIGRNRSIIAPFLLRAGKMWSNFWGSVTNQGYYKRSDDYMEIIEGKKRGQWNVPYLDVAYMIQASSISKLLGHYIDPDNNETDPDMAFANNNRRKGMFMYVDNQFYYGHLVNNDNPETKYLHNDLYHILDNNYTWAKKYLHVNYSLAFNEDYKFEEDSRIGGYESVPTDDIHTNQFGWEKQWLKILADYIGPLNGRAFQGYLTNNRAILNFVVKYNPERQKKLMPHEDTSTYTINLALNIPGEDYQGGGVKFIRYNCSVTDTKKGWLLMHPGRLTHYHEGLETTGGTRYIMVSFIDPP